jgi:hypothetical protein
MSKLTEVITKIVIEAIETKAILQELERAFPYLPSNYYYNRKVQLERRVEELENILSKAEIGYSKDAPAEQYLVTDYR